MKKFLAFVAMFCLLLTSVTAFAENSFPSKTVSDMTIVEVVQTATGVVPADDLVVTVAEETVEITAEVAAMRDFVAEKTLVEYFPETVQEEIAAVLPAGTAAADIVAYELLPVAVENYDETYGDMTIDFTFATVFPEGAEVLVLLGLPTDEVVDGVAVVEWIVKTAVVTEGKMSIAFTQEELVRMNAKDSLLVVMGAPIAE